MQSDTEKQVKSTPYKVISFTAVVGFIAAYTHFFGLSYRKSFLEGAGFESVGVSLTPDESIYYAVHGFTHGIGALLKLDYWQLDSSRLSIGIGMGLVPMLVWLYRKYLNSYVADSEFMKSCVKSVEDSIFKILGISILSFCAGYFIQVIASILIVSVLAFFWVLMALGIQVGHSDGQKLISTPVCSDIEWEEYEADRVLSCRKQTLSSGTVLSGVRLHLDKRAEYFLSNDGAYEIDNAGKVISFRPIVSRPNDK